jgi:hypothetical protein
MLDATSAACRFPLVTSDASLPSDLADHLGPVSYIAVEFPRVR